MNIRRSRCFVDDLYSPPLYFHSLYSEFPLFDFPSLLRYRAGDDEALEPLSRIADKNMERLIRHMLNRDPSKRLSAEKYLSEWENMGFPRHFRLLHGYTARLMGMTPDKVFDHPSCLLRLATWRNIHCSFFESEDCPSRQHGSGAVGRTLSREGEGNHRSAERLHYACIR